MLFAVSLAYKESASCRLEANYGMQNECDMIALMLQKDYKANGWLGLILGTRLWYGFWDADEDDDAAFEKRVDGLCNEIGDRGRLMLPEAVPPPEFQPEPEPQPEPQPQPEPEPAPSHWQLVEETVAPNTTSSSSYSPSVHGTPTLTAAATPMQPANLQLQQSAGSSPALGPALMEVSAFMAEQLQLQRDHDERIREAAQAERAELQSQMEQQRHEIEALREMARPKMAAEVLSDKQLAALQQRFVSLHAAALLSDTELYFLEDGVIDCIEVLPEAPAAMPEVATVAKMVMLSEKVPVDATFARQVRRKFVAAELRAGGQKDLESTAAAWIAAAKGSGE